MKQRNGFVSNSSSSSFVLKYDPADFQQCGYCKHTPRTPLQLIYDSENDYVETEDVQGLIDDTNGDIDQVKVDLADSVKYGDDDQPFDWSKMTTDEWRDSWRKNLKTLERRLKKLNKLIDSSKVICRVSLDYCSGVRDQIDSLVDQGLVKKPKWIN